MSNRGVRLFVRGSCGALVAIAALGSLNSQARAAVIAQDNASDAAYAGGWTNGSNGGTGFGPWLLQGDSGGTFAIGNSTTNGDGLDDGMTGGAITGVAGDGDINSIGGKAFGINNANFPDAVRPLVTPLATGQVFSIDFDAGFFGNGEFQGFGLNSDTDARVSLGSHSGDFFVGDSLITQPTGIGFTDEGMHVAITITGPDTYSLTATRRDGVTATVTGTMAGSGAITKVVLLNLDQDTSTPLAKHTAFFNNMQVADAVPEPASATLLILGAAAILRRRRT